MGSVRWGLLALLAPAQADKPMAPPPPPPGWLGVYHAAGGSVRDGKNTSAFDVGGWGIVAPDNEPYDGGLSFREAVSFNCKTKDINQLWGILVAHSEGGVYNNTNDTDLWRPLSHLRHGPGPAPGPQGVGALLQGAARWSTLARTYCPQIAGVLIDDFWSNFDGAKPEPCPPPGPPGACSSCPSDRPHIYGNANAGLFCCQTPELDHHCSGTGPCCLWPSPTLGCQKTARCGTNPLNQTPCVMPRPQPPPPPTPQGLGMDHMRDIKAVLSGHTLRPDGTIDHGSPATTPHLQLFVVTYDREIPNLDTELVRSGAVDGISFWISGEDQERNASALTSMVAQIRAMVPPSMPVFTGGYITYSTAKDSLTPGPFYDLLAQSVDLYDANVVQGVYIFAGSVLQAKSSSWWQRWDLPGHLQRSYFPFLGRASITVRDATSQSAVDNSVVTVVYNGSTHVTRKRTDAMGVARFGGWVGKARRAPHTVSVAAPGYEEARLDVQLRAGETVSVSLKLVKSLQLKSDDARRQTGDSGVEDDGSRSQTIPYFSQTLTVRPLRV